MDQDTEFIHIGTRTIFREQIAEIDHNYELTMAEGGPGRCTLVLLRSSAGALPENYLPYIYVRDEEGRKNLLQFCGAMAHSGNLQVISQGLRNQHWGTRTTTAGVGPQRETSTATPDNPPPAKKRAISAATRRKMAAGQKARHAKAKAAGTGA